MSMHLLNACAGQRLLCEWQRLTQSGMQASRDDCPEQALAWHERALRVAHQLFHDAPAGVCDDDRLATFVVAHLNLADCFTILHQPGSAGECIQCAHHQLLALARDVHTSASMRAAASKHLRYTFAALAEHQRHCIPRECDAIPADFSSGYPPPGALLH